VYLNGDPIVGSFNFSTVSKEREFQRRPGLTSAYIYIKSKVFAAVIAKALSFSASSAAQTSMDCSWEARLVSGMCTSRCSVI
jgi:hypothetical protein